MSGPLTRNAYTVKESFETDNGRTYLKVEYKGINQTGYLSRVKGPGNPITRDWYRRKKREWEKDRDETIYRSTIIADRDTKDQYGRETNIRAEAWLQTDDEHQRSEAIDVWNSVLNAVYKMVARDVGVDVDKEFEESNKEIHKDEARPSDRAGFVTLKNRTYEVDLSNETMEFIEEGTGML